MDFIQTVQMTNTLMLHKYIQNSVYEGAPCSIIALQFDFDTLDIQYRMLYYIERLRKRMFCLPLGKNKFIFTVDMTLGQAVLFAETIQKYLKTKFDYNLKTIAITSFEETANFVDSARDMIERVESFLLLSASVHDIVYGTKIYNSTEDIDFKSLFKYMLSNNYKTSMVHFDEIEGDYTKSDISIRYFNDNIIIGADIKDFIYLYNANAKEVILKNDYIIGKISANIQRYDFDKSEIICNDIKIDKNYLFRRADKRITPQQSINAHITNGKEELTVGNIIDFSKSSISMSLPKEVITSDLIEKLKKEDLFVYFTIADTKLIITADFYTIKEEEDSDNAVLIMFLFLEKAIEDFIDKLYKNAGIRNIEKAKEALQNFRQDKAS